MRGRSRSCGIFLFSFHYSSKISETKIKTFPWNLYVLSNGKCSNFSERVNLKVFSYVARGRSLSYGNWFRPRIRDLKWNYKWNNNIIFKVFRNIHNHELRSTLTYSQVEETSNEITHVTTTWLTLHTKFSGIFIISMSCQSISCYKIIHNPENSGQHRCLNSFHI